jgi:hypothetical protein
VLHKTRVSRDIGCTTPDMRHMRPTTRRAKAQPSISIAYQSANTLGRFCAGPLTDGLKRLVTPFDTVIWAKILLGSPLSHLCGFSTKPKSRETKLQPCCRSKDPDPILSQTVTAL